MDQIEMRRVLEGFAAGAADLTVKGKKMPCLAVNGNMFAFVDPGGAHCLRFAEAERAGYVAAFGTGPVLQYGAVMRGYVAIPPAVIADEVRRAALFAECVAHARSLRPKPTKR